MIYYPNSVKIIDFNRKRFLYYKANGCIEQKIANQHFSHWSNNTWVY